jgi:hypothetical protein
VTAADGSCSPNAPERQSIADHDTLTCTADGSRDLVLEAEWAGRGRGVERVRVAKAPSNVLRRRYRPKRTILDGTWTPPVPRAHQRARDDSPENGLHLAFVCVRMKRACVNEVWLKLHPRADIVG